MRSQSRFVFWFRIFLTGACVGAIILQFGGSKPWENFHLLRPGALLLGFAVVPILLIVRAWKWRTLLRTRAPEASLVHALRSYLGALPLSLITPGKAGELIRGFYLPYPETRGLRAAGLTAVDNAADFAAVAWWTLPALFVLGGWAAATGGFGACLLLCGLPIWLRALRALGGVLPERGRWSRIWNRFWPDAQSMRWKPCLTAIAIGVAAYGIEWFQMRCFLSALGAPASSYWTLSGNLALIQWANSIQITVAGLGLREGSTAWLLNRSGWDSHTVILAAFLQTSASLLLPALAGLFIKPMDPEFQAPESTSQNSQALLTPQSK